MEIRYWVSSFELVLWNISFRKSLESIENYFDHGARWRCYSIGWQQMARTRKLVNHHNPRNNSKESTWNAMITIMKLIGMISHPFTEIWDLSLALEATYLYSIGYFKLLINYLWNYAITMFIIDVYMFCTFDEGFYYIFKHISVIRMKS